MALYLGNSNKLKVYLNGVAYHFNLFTTNITINGIQLLSLDDYILRDSNGLYLTIKDGE